MHTLDSSGFEPRYFCFNDLRRPSDPFQSLPLNRFLEELPFWGITGGIRPSIYAAINGAVLYDNLGNPEEYRHFIESIGVELESIALFTQAINERYCRIKCDLQERSMANANALAFIAVIDDFTKQIATQCKGAEIPAWCGVFFAMGMYGAHTRSSLTADILARSMEGSQLGESYLFEYIRNVGLQFDFMDEEDPMDRFLGRCYPNTPYERKFIAKRILPQVTSIIEANNDAESLAHIFMRSHDLTAEIATKEPATVQMLLFDIEQSGPGSVKANIDCFESLLGGCKSFPWSFTSLWNAGRELIHEQHPTLIQGLSGHAQRIAELSYFQKMVDFAIWSALFGTTPEAFYNFNMEPFNKLRESTPDRFSLN